VKVYISVDMEGIAGVATLDQVVRGGHGYDRACLLMTDEANAAVRGAFDGGATEVVVSDSHGTMDNLLHERLDPRARLVFGRPRGFCMAEGLTEEHDLALFVGYHAPAGARGVLAHTFSSHFLGVRVNGEDASETSVNALFAATRGVPVGLVTGDDVICHLAEAMLPGVVTAPVKVAHGYSAANTLAPSVARDLVQTRARDAVRRAGTMRLAPVPDSLRLELDMPNLLAAEMASAIPGTVRIGDRTIARDIASADELLGLVTVGFTLAHVALLERSVLVVGH